MIDIGMIGLGRMGGAMSALLVAAGKTVIGFDPSLSARAAARQAGLAIADDPTEVFQETAIVLLSLPSAGALSATLGAASSVTEKRIIVELSTLSLAEKMAALRQAADLGHVLLDVPVSGTGAQAQVGDISFYVSGAEEEAKDILPILKLIGRPRYVGAFGTGTQVKLLANLLVAIHNTSTAECLSLGIRAGLDPDMLVDVLGDGAGGSRMLQIRGPLMAADSYQPATMSLKLWAKDMSLIADFARDHGAATPLFDLVRKLYDSLAISADPDDDTAAIMRLYQAPEPISSPA